MAETFTLDLVTPERMVVDGLDVEELVVPGAYGEIGILPHHAPLLGTLRPGVLWYRTPGGKVEHVAVCEGFVEVSPDRVTVLANTAQFGHEVDVSEEERAAREAEDKLADQTDHAERAAVEAAVGRARARIRASGLHG